MKRLSQFALPAILLMIAACSGQKEVPSVSWEPVNDTDSTYLQKFTLTGDLRGYTGLAFCQMLTDPMTLSESSDTLKELLPGYYLITSSKFSSADGRDSITFTLSAPGSFYQRSFGPDGVHLVASDGTPVPVEIKIADLLSDSKHYANSRRNRMPDAAGIFAMNEEIIPSGAPGDFDFIPRFKSVATGSGTSIVNLDDIEFENYSGDNPEEYAISISGGKIKVKAPEKMWPSLRKRINHFLGTGTRELPDAEITDFPDFPYRGLHLDVARNWTPVEQVKKILDYMAVYGLNKLHFHFVDDEAWRIEIKGLPELTEVGSRRGFSADGYTDFLPQRYGGDPLYIPGSEDKGRFITREEYIDLLRYADNLGIEVIPEIEAPGHARAAIMAMNERARRTGDDSWLLRRADDPSVYETAQGYRDAVMDPSLPGPYKLLETVFDEIIAMHKEAGAPLVAIHIGGDEVPKGSWGRNPYVKEIMEAENLTSDEDVHAWFMRKVAPIYSDRGLKMMAWEEVAKGHGKEYDDLIRPLTYGVNLWTYTRNKNTISQIANSGYPLIISNVDRYYLDMAYSGHPYEPGLSWGGYVDEFTALEGHPKDMCPYPDARIMGVQGELWSETLRSPEDVERLLFPKMLGLAERGWNNDSTYSRKEFNTLIGAEMPKWSESGITFHVRQPGISVSDGEATFNSPYMTGEIRYTFDGSDPTAESELAVAGTPVKIPSDARQIRARIFMGDKKSVATLKEL